MRRYRLFHVLLALCIGITALTGRLFWLQSTSGVRPAGTEDVAELSVRQRSEGVTLHTGRGDIVDRNGRPFTGASVNGLLLLPGGAERLDEATRQAMARALFVTPDRLTTIWRSVTRPVWWTREGASPVKPTPLTPEQADTLRRLRPEGAVVAVKNERYPEDRLAAHAVGFVAEQPERIERIYGDRLEEGRMALSTPIGASGLELAFDRFLHGQNATRIVAYTDAHGERLEGLGVRTMEDDNPYYPLRLVTTIDASVQDAVESIAAESGIAEGAIVVLDAETADIAAMASFPSYRADRVSPQATDWMNRAISAYTPGSVMKSFVAAVALEEGAATPDETFVCDGTYPKYGLTCWKEGGHGTITFREGLAESCNLVFAEVGERLSGETLQLYAEQLGLAGTVGWTGASAVDEEAVRHFPEEQPGRLFAGAPEEADGGVLAQTAIGQRDVRVSPLAAANWMVTLLRGGLANRTRVVSEIRFADDHPLERYASARMGHGRPLSARTVHALRSMLGDVVADGTGASLASASWPLAGKSGTAETTDGGQTVHQWFVGYGPADQPRYAVAVAALNRPAESANAATAMFGRVMEALAEREREERL
ncbi:hypothetical protein MO973_26025 [Paenibacillus sp. TRM 82003]|nr:hypothetical protein [Paenibacillus sp. TRM 82003]